MDDISDRATLLKNGPFGHLDNTVFDIEYMCECRKQTFDKFNT